MKRFLIPLLAALALPSTVQALPYEVNNNSRDIHRRCTSSIDYQKCINSYSQNEDLTNTNARRNKTYLFSVANTGGDVHSGLNGRNIIPTNNLRHCQSLARKQEQFFSEASSNMTKNFTLFYKCIKGVSEGNGNYKLYIFAQNVWKPNTTDSQAANAFHINIIPMKNFSQCSVAKFQIDNLATQMQAKATEDLYPEFYTKCIKSLY